MKLAKYGLSAMVLCFFSGLAFADSISTIPITGTAWYGFATSFGDFSFQGPGLNLFQSSPDGPNIIASCLPGTTCSLGFGIPNALEYCGYCTSYSSGSLGSNVAEFLERLGLYSRAKGIHGLRQRSRNRATHIRWPGGSFGSNDQSLWNCVDSS